jgi:hypothetical protein
VGTGGNVTEVVTLPIVGCATASEPKEVTKKDTNNDNGITIFNITIFKIR